MTKTNNEYLPKGYTPPTSDFMKLNEGDNELRIVSFPTIGKLYWMSPEGEVREKGIVQKGDKPYRIPFDADLPKGVHASQAKEFWMLKVWNYQAKAIQILEINQQTIIRALAEFIANVKWGDPREYDINIKKEGSGKETKYFVMPSPPEAVSSDISEAIRNNTTDLDSFLVSHEDETEKEKTDNEPEDAEVDEENLPF